MNSRDGTSHVVVITPDPVFPELCTRFQGSSADRADYHFAREADEGLALITRLRPACAVIDVSTLGLSGLEIIDRIHRIDAGLPVIVINDAGREFTAIEAFRLGAWDYLIKSSITPEALSLAVDGAVRNPAVQHESTTRDTRPRTRRDGGEAPPPAASGRHRLEPSRLNAAILDSAKVMIIATAKDGTILEFNRAAEDKLGYSAAEVVGKQTVALLHEPTEVARHAADRARSSLGSMSELGIIGRQALTEGVETREWTYIRKDGTRFTAELTISPLRDASQRLVGYLGIGHDISHRKEIERIKNEFVAVVSHELRTPMTAIMGAIGLVTSGKVGDVGPNGLRLLEVAHRNCQRLVRLITQILDIERMESGRMTLRTEDVALAEMIAEAATENEAFVGAYRSRIRVLDCPEDIFIKADRDKISQVLTNLISNAAKFSSSDTDIEIQVSFDGVTARISVTDHGSGIAESFHDQVFEKFAQADSSDTRRRDGSGLGLSIVRTIVEAHGGTVSFDTEVGKGTSFHVDLAAWKGDAGQELSESRV